VIMLTAPIPATLKALKKSGLSIGDIGAFEVNEAFAPVPLAWLAETGADPDRPQPGRRRHRHRPPARRVRRPPDDRPRPRMAADGVQYGLQTMCEGGGMANAPSSNASPDLAPFTHRPTLSGGVDDVWPAQHCCTLVLYPVYLERGSCLCRSRRRQVPAGDP